MDNFDSVMTAARVSTPWLGQPRNAGELALTATSVVRRPDHNYIAAPLAPAGGAAKQAAPPRGVPR